MKNEFATRFPARQFKLESLELRLLFFRSATSIALFFCPCLVDSRGIQNHPLGKFPFTGLSTLIKFRETFDLPIAMSQMLRWSVLRQKVINNPRLLDLIDLTNSQLLKTSFTYKPSSSTLKHRTGSGPPCGREGGPLGCI